VDGREERRVVDEEEVWRVRWGLVREREVEEEEDIVVVVVGERERELVSDYIMMIITRKRK